MADHNGIALKFQYELSFIDFKQDLFIANLES